MKQRISASQMSLYQRCPRAWAYEKVLGFKRPASKAMAFGTELHKVAEDALNGSGPIKSDRTGLLVWEAITLGYLPIWSHTTTEVEIKGVLDIDGAEIPYLGYIDAIEHDKEDVLTAIIDHKTASSWAYVETPETLLYNAQMSLYAYHVMAHEAMSEIEIKHIQYASKGPIAVRQVSALMTQDRALSNLKPWARIYREMIKIKAELQTDGPIGNVPVKRSGCNAYGGCAHKRRCSKRLL